MSNVKLNQIEEEIVKVANEIAEKDFNEVEPKNALIFMDICDKHDIKFRKADELHTILNNAKADKNIIQNTWKKLYN